MPPEARASGSLLVQLGNICANYFARVTGFALIRSTQQRYNEKWYERAQ